MTLMKRNRAKVILLIVCFMEIEVKNDDSSLKKVVVVAVKARTSSTITTSNASNDLKEIVFGFFTSLRAFCVYFSWPQCTRIGVSSLLRVRISVLH